VKITETKNGMFEKNNFLLSELLSERIAKICPNCDKVSTVKTMLCQWLDPE
jgi:hypothetical protein